jgi:hypothetical protein
MESLNTKANGKMENSRRAELGGVENSILGGRPITLSNHRMMSNGKFSTKADGRTGFPMAEE